MDNDNMIYLKELNERLQARGFSFWTDDYLNLKEALPEILEYCTKRYATGFKAGQLSVKRKNKSGCCCIIDEEQGDKVIQACGAHLTWLEENKSN